MLAECALVEPVVCAYRIKVQLCLVHVLHSIFTSVWHLCTLLKSAEMILLVAAFDFCEWCIYLVKYGSS